MVIRVIIMPTNRFPKVLKTIKKSERDNISKVLSSKINSFKYLYGSNDFYEYVICMNKSILKLKIMFRELEKQGIKFLPSTVNICQNNAKPFWNDKIRKISDKLFLPSNDNINMIDENISKNSWFQVKQYHPNEKPEFKLKYETPVVDMSEDATIIKKIKLKMNPTQKYYLRQFIGTYRYYYNRCVKIKRETWFYVYPNESKESDKKKISLKIDKSKFYLDKCYVRSLLGGNKPNWIFDKFPVHLINNALFECLKNFDNCMSKFKKTGKPFKLKFKNKRKNIQTMNLEATMIKKCSLFTNFKVDNKYIFRDIQKKILPKGIKHGDSTLSYDYVSKEVYLNLSHDIPKIRPKKNNICSLDPGVNNFMTCYSQKEISVIGIDCENIIYKICKEIDILTSKINKKKDNSSEFEHNSNKRRNFKKVVHRKRKKLKNIKKELHNKTINYLCKNYSVIIIPMFKVKQIAKKLNNKSARMLYNLSHSEFRERLKGKAERMNIKVHVRDEYYTTKTCGKCGNLNYDMTTEKEYNCAKCGLKIGRDINAARNILLKNLYSV